MYSRGEENCRILSLITSMRIINKYINITAVAFLTLLLRIQIFNISRKSVNNVNRIFEVQS